MTIKEAIERSIEGGYQFENVNQFEESISHYSDCWYFHEGFDFLIPEIVLYPSFWKCLGKTEGWIKASADILDDQRIVGDMWKIKMHAMLDHLIQGGTITSYFKTL